MWPIFTIEWFFVSIKYPYIREELLLNSKCDTSQKTFKEKYLTKSYVAHNVGRGSIL